MKKFLVIRFSSIGDIVLTTPVVRCLKKQVAGAEVHYLTKKSYAPVIADNPYISKYFFLDDDLDAIISDLKKENYDLVVDLHHNLRTSVVKRKLGKPSRSFYKLNFQKWLMVNLKINRLPPVSIIDRYLDTVKDLAVKNDGEGLDFFISPEDEVRPGELPEAHRNGYIAFVIGAKHNTKKLPPEKIISIIKKLNKPVILMGGKEDEPSASFISSQLPTPNSQLLFNACGNFSLSQSASFLKQADAVITHDTGLMHIAAAFKKKIISVWGNTIPEFGMYPYYGNTPISNFKFQISNLSCRPCSKLGFKECPEMHFRCMNLQDEEMIVQAALS